MIRRIKHWIARKLLADEVARIDMERQAFKDAQRKFDEWRRSITAKDVLREQMAGLNPKLLDRVSSGDSDILDSITDGENLDAFLSSVKAIHNSSAFHKISDWIIRNQVIHTARDAATNDAVNFGRATINGVDLIKEEIERLAKIYEDRHAQEPEFDEHEVV